MRLYVCRGTWRGATPRPFRRAELHPCGVAHEALTNLTPGRRKVKHLTGEVTVSVLVTDEGRVVAGSSEIAAWGRARP